MKNIDIIKSFLEGKEGRTKNLKSEIREINGKDITLLINYETIIAFIDVDNLTIYLDNNKYSSTTSTIQNKLKQILDIYNYNIEYYTNDIYNNVANKLLQEITANESEEKKQREELAQIFASNNLYMINNALNSKKKYNNINLMDVILSYILQMQDAIDKKEMEEINNVINKELKRSLLG